MKKQKRKKENCVNNLETLHNACVEKRSMTRKVTAGCFRKRLLLLPYTYKLYATHHVPSTPADKPDAPWAFRHVDRRNMHQMKLLYALHTQRTHTKRTFTIKHENALHYSHSHYFCLILADVSNGQVQYPLRVSSCVLLKWTVGKNVPFVVFCISIFRVPLITGLRTASTDVPLNLL